MSPTLGPSDAPVVPFLACVTDEDAREFVAAALRDLARQRDWVGLLVRRHLLAAPDDDDPQLAEEAVQEAVAMQDPLGYWDVPLATVRTETRLTATGQYLWLLFELGVAPDEPHVCRAADWVLEQPPATKAVQRQRKGKKPKLALWGDNNAALWALVAFGVASPVVDLALANAEELHRRWVGKPDLHFAHMGPLAAAGRFHSPAMEAALTWMRESQASDGFWPGNPAIPALLTILQLPEETAAPLFARMLAAVNRDLARVQAWPDRLRTHGVPSGPLDSKDYLRYLFFRCMARHCGPKSGSSRLSA